MKKMKIINFLISTSVLIFILNSCGKEPVENPCECGQKPVSANFTIMEKYYVDQFLNDVYTPYDTDTLTTGVTNLFWRTSNLRLI
jgi:hypothetical protein